MPALGTAERELERYRYFSRMANVSDSPEVWKTFHFLAGESLRRATRLDPSAPKAASAAPMVAVG